MSGFSQNADVMNSKFLSSSIKMNDSPSSLKSFRPKLKGTFFSSRIGNKEFGSTAEIKFCFRTLSGEIFWWLLHGVNVSLPSSIRETFISTQSKIKVKWSNSWGVNTYHNFSADSYKIYTRGVTVRFVSQSCQAMAMLFKFVINQDQ